MEPRWMKRWIGAGLLSTALTAGCNHADVRSESVMPSRSAVTARVPGSGSTSRPATASTSGPSPTSMSQVASNKPESEPMGPSLAITDKMETAKDMPKEGPLLPPPTFDAQTTSAKDPAIELASAKEAVAAPSAETKAPMPVPDAPTTASPTFGHAEDYSWVKGQLQYSRTHNNWRLRYAGLDEVDPYGGSVSLADDLRAAGYRDGQCVRINGRLINADNRSIAPTYQVESIQALDK